MAKIVVINMSMPFTSLVKVEFGWLLGPSKVRTIMLSKMKKYIVFSNHMLSDQWKQLIWYRNLRNPIFFR